MIYLLVILDILLNNYSNFNTYFFIIYLYNKKYKYYLLTGLILDLIIFNNFYNTIILSIIYLFNKVFKDLNKNNIYNYIYINSFNYLMYIILTNVFVLNSIKEILLSVGYNLLINAFFYVLSYNLYRKYLHS